MASMVRRQEIEPEVDFFGLSLQEADSDSLSEFYPAGRVGADFLTAHEGRVDIESAGHTHTAAMTVEVWDGEPTPDSRLPWEAQGEVGLFSWSGQLQVWGVACGAIEALVDLGRAETSWRVRVYCAGREEVARLTASEVPEGVEQYLTQFWPTR